jgi:hypothetical protein
MSYIIKSTSPFVSIKLTQTGRQLLASGQLNFNYWAIGDSELDYGREQIVDTNQSDVTLSASSVVLRPVDREPNLKYYIKPINATDQFNTIDSSVLNVVKAVVNNAAIERGFFSHDIVATKDVFTTLSSSTYISYSQTLLNTKLTGGTKLDLTSTSSFSVGDLMLLKLANVTCSGSITNENTRALPNLWFKVKSITGNTITVDRQLPKYSGDASNSQVIIYRGGEVWNTIATGNTTAYWDSGTLSFDSANNVTCSDVPVWNMNNVWCESPAGITGTTYENYTKFGSYDYLGQKYPLLGFGCSSASPEASAKTNSNGVGLSYADEINKSISIVHYTNNTISNLYGEFFYTDLVNGKYFNIFIPDMMYHRHNYSTASGTTQGMSFIASGTTKLLTNTDLEYIDLIEDPKLIGSSTPLVVGKVFPQLKIAVFSDDEIVAAMSYKSNRNWTLPSLSAVLNAPSGGTSTGVLAVGQTMYLTYILENSGTISGLTTSMPCQNYVKITNSTASAKDVAFKIAETDLLPYMRKIENVGYDGLGFYADRFKLVYQIVSDTSTRPDSGSWKVYDFTSTAITGVVDKTINPILLENQTPSVNGFILDLLKNNTATTFDLISKLDLAPNSAPTNLQFGDERFFYGNLTTYIGATIYKTIFDIRVNSGKYDSTNNPTRSTDAATNPPAIKITEVGIYDNNKNLVCIGKLSNPVPLSDGNTIMLELSMDF